MKSQFYSRPFATERFVTRPTSGRLRASTSGPNDWRRTLGYRSFVYFFSRGPLFLGVSGIFSATLRTSRNLLSRLCRYLIFINIVCFFFFVVFCSGLEWIENWRNEEYIYIDGESVTTEADKKFVNRLTLARFLMSPWCSNVRR